MKQNNVPNDEDVVQMTEKEYKELLFYKSYYEAHTQFSQGFHEDTYQKFVEDCANNAPKKNYEKNIENYPSLHGCNPYEKVYNGDGEYFIYANGRFLTECNEDELPRFGLAP